MAASYPFQKRRRAVERSQFRTQDGCTLAVAHFHTDASVERGILLIPPLIGASYILFGRQFSFLVKSGYRIVSLNFRGHDPSEGRFSLFTSFTDTLALARSLKHANPDTPVSAVGTCSGSMPLFHILDQEPDLLESVVFVNAIHDIQQTATPLQGLRMYHAARGLRRPASLGDAVSVVLDEVFPAIPKDADRFGILRYDQVRKATLIREYLFRGGPSIRWVSRAPALCIYGMQDRMLGLADPAAERRYCDEFRKKFSQIEFDTFDADHFMVGLREQVARRILTFLSENTAHAGASRLGKFDISPVPRDDVS